MKQKLICGCTSFLSLFIVIGIIGGVEQGQPIANMFWCIPLLAIMCLSGYLAGIFN